MFVCECTLVALEMTHFFVVKILLDLARNIDFSGWCAIFFFVSWLVDGWLVGGWRVRQIYGVMCDVCEYRISCKKLCVLYFISLINVVFCGIRSFFFFNLINFNFFFYFKYSICELLFSFEKSNVFDNQSNYMGRKKFFYQLISFLN